MEPHYIEIRKIVEDDDLTETKPMESYYVTVRSAGDDNRMQWRFSADNFAHAEEQCKAYLDGDMEIITIERDYKV